MGAVNKENKPDPLDIGAMSDESRYARGLRATRAVCGGGGPTPSVGPGLRKQSYKRWMKRRQRKKLARGGGR